MLTCDTATFIGLIKCTPDPASLRYRPRHATLFAFLTRLLQKSRPAQTRGNRKMASSSEMEWNNTPTLRNIISLPPAPPSHHILYPRPSSGRHCHCWTALTDRADIVMTESHPAPSRCCPPYGPPPAPSTLPYMVTWH